MQLESLTATFARLATVAVPVGAALALAACASTPIAPPPAPAPVVFGSAGFISASDAFEGVRYFVRDIRVATVARTVNE